MEESFKKIRKEIETFEKGTHELSSHFASALFPFPPNEFLDSDLVEVGPLVDTKEAEIQEVEKQHSNDEPLGIEEPEVIEAEGVGPNLDTPLSKEEVFGFINEGAINVSENAPEKGIEIPLVCLGLLREDPENEQNIIVNDSFSKMVAAMNFDEGFVKKHESLRYYSQDSEEVTDFFRNICANNTKVLLAFGAADIRIVLNKREKLSRIHGKFLKKSIKFNDHTHEFYIVPVFHPEYLLANQGMKKLAWDDLQGVMSFFKNN